MRIAIEGCAHGELEIIYEALQHLEQQENMKIDLLICCGDFQSTRNEQDLRCMAVPPKYYNMCSFYKYYSGEKKAPFLTIFIGGNHEASNYLQELPYGGWVAPNIYYLGYAGVVKVAGIRIGGISGIFKGRDYMCGHFESAPYNENTKRSVYHVRNLEVFRLKQLSHDLDIFLSHDWPSGVFNFGNKQQLLRFKPHFKEDMERDELGSRPCKELLELLQPEYWFAAHLHCKFTALVPHSRTKYTKFLALDKCLPRRRYLQVVTVPHNESEPIEIKYDLEWLAILKSTNHLLSVKKGNVFMPSSVGNERYNFTPTEEEKAFVLTKFEENLRVPLNFVKTAPVYNPSSPQKSGNIKQPTAVLNPQTVEFCQKLCIDDPLTLVTDLNISDISEHNGSFANSSTFIADTDVSTEESPRKRISLSLPEPKSSFCDSMDLKETSIGAKEALLWESLRMEKAADKDLPVASADLQATSTTSVENSSMLGVKKFKRRNADLYSQE